MKLIVNHYSLGGVLEKAVVIDYESIQLLPCMIPDEYRNSIPDGIDHAPFKARMYVEYWKKRNFFLRFHIVDCDGNVRLW